MTTTPNQSLEPTAGRCEIQIRFYETVPNVCHARRHQRWLSSFSLDVMSVPCKRWVRLPLLFTVVFAITYLVPIHPSLFALHLERLSGIGAPAFMVFRELSGVADLAPVDLRYAIQCVLLSVVALCWFTFICLPFWSDFRVGDLSLRSSRFLFATAGLIITAVCWLHLGGWQVHDG